jgi:hypothetical protein
MLLDVLVCLLTIVWYFVVLAETLVYRGLLELRRLSSHASENSHPYYKMGKIALEEPQPALAADRAWS